MARERMVTRTVLTTELTVLCMDIEKAEVIEKTIIITGYTPADNKLLKIAQKRLDTDTLKATYIKNIVEKETLYGMPETEFIKIAQVLPPRGTPKVHKVTPKNDTPKPKSEAPKNEIEAPKTKVPKTEAPKNKEQAPKNKTEQPKK